MSMRIGRRPIAVVSAIVGIALFIYIIEQTGVTAIYTRLRLLGAGFLLILAISATRYFSRTIAWRYCMAPEERRLGIWTLWRARLAGEAIGDLTFGPVIAEPLRLVALGDKLSLSSGISSLAVENIAYAFSSCLMIMAGTICLLARLGLSESLRTAVLVSLAIVSVIITVSFAVIGHRLRLVSGAGIVLSQILIGNGGRRSSIEDKIRSLADVEDYVFDFYTRRRSDFFIVVLCGVAFHLAGVVEIYATLRMTGVDLTLAVGFMLEAINRVINIAFVFVPALVGVDEAGTGLMTGTLGLGAATGVTLAIVRKMRMFFWIGAGLIFLAAGRKGR